MRVKRLCHIVLRRMLFLGYRPHVNYDRYPCSLSRAPVSNQLIANPSLRFSQVLLILSTTYPHYLGRLAGRSEPPSLGPFSFFPYFVHLFD